MFSEAIRLFNNWAARITRENKHKPKYLSTSIVATVALVRHERFQHIKLFQVEPRFRIDGHLPAQAFFQGEDDMVFLP